MEGMPLGGRVLGRYRLGRWAGTLPPQAGAQRLRLTEAKPVNGLGSRPLALSSARKQAGWGGGQARHRCRQQGQQRWVLPHSQANRRPHPKHDTCVCKGDGAWGSTALTVRLVPPLGR